MPLWSFQAQPHPLTKPEGHVVNQLRWQYTFDEEEDLYEHP